MTDYLILGGGLAGCTVASRIKQYDPSASVTLVEAGSDEHANPLITEPMATFQLHMSPLEYNYHTVPQRHYDGRQVYNTGGKVLSGSSAVNYAMCPVAEPTTTTFGHTLLGTKDGVMRACCLGFHGFDGPIHTTASARNYPLKELLHQSFKQGTDLPYNHDANGGNPIGIAPYTENWYDGKRQPAGKAYGLNGVEILTNSPIHRIILEGNIAKEKSSFLAAPSVRRIYFCFPALDLSTTLSKYGIKQLIDAPDVGLNFHDHVCMAQFYKIKNPRNNLVAGASGWNDPSYLLGIPADIVVTANAPRETLKAAMVEDGTKGVTDSHPHLQSTRGHIEILPIYAPTEAPLTDLNIPFDGTCLTLGALNLLPTSRGSVRLASADPTADPLIDPNYYATEADRVVVREGMRLAMRAVETPAGQAMVEEEIVPAGFEALTSKSSDEDIDKRVRRSASTWFHPAGSAAMGKVVDTELRVMGVERLRVVDPSVFPCPIGAHTQVATYALAEQAAAFITSAWKDNL